MKTILTILFSFSISFLFGQLDTIHFTNPSFEGQPLEGGIINKGNYLPRGWRDCGFRGETPPDVHPVRGGNFSVAKSPAHGNTYMGMVVRDNDTWEKMSQRLEKPLKAGKCYSLSVALARSETYLSQSRVTGKPANYVQPIQVRFHGGNEYCKKEQLLASSPLIKNSRWRQYQFIIQPDQDYKYFTIEAFYKTPTLYPYNGNVLVDNLSPIFEIECDSAILQQKAKMLEVADSDFSKYHTEIYNTNQVNTNNRPASKTTGYSTKQDKKIQRLKPLLDSLATIGLFEKNIREENSEGVQLLKEIAAIVKSDPYIGLNIGVKVGEDKSLQRWRKKLTKNIINETNLHKLQFDVSKFNKFYEQEWDAENEIISIRVYKRT